MSWTFLFKLTFVICQPVLHSDLNINVGIFNKIKTYCISDSWQKGIMIFDISQVLYLWPYFVPGHLWHNEQLTLHWICNPKIPILLCLRCLTEHTISWNFPSVDPDESHCLFALNASCSVGWYDISLFAFLVMYCDVAWMKTN